MAKLHVTTSPFLSPILIPVEGVHWVRHYAAAQLMNMHVEVFGDYATQNSIPKFYDGERVLFLVDHRESGEGGKFHLQNRFGKEPFPGWKKGLICP